MTMSRDFDFLSGDDAMRALMRERDWSRSPLGHPETWSPALRTLAGMMLDSKFPMFLAWGPELGFIYNAPYAEVLGAKHPEAMGGRFRDIWEEIWDVVSPLVGRALAGEATFHEDLPLLMLRNGHEEQTWFTFSYSPARDESGRIAGMLCACTETTARVLLERRQEFQLQLADRVRGLTESATIMSTTSEAIGRLLRVARAGYGEVAPPDDTISVAGEWTDGRLAPLAGAAGPLRAFGKAALQALREGHTICVDDVEAAALTAPCAATYAACGARAVLAVPLRKGGRLHALMYLHDPAPRCWTADEVMLAEHVTERTWAALELARAEEQRRRAEEALNAQLAAEHQRLRKLFEQAPGFMAVLRGPDHVFELANAAFTRLVGTRLLIGRTVRDAMPELEGQAFIERLDQVYRSGEPYFASEAQIRLRRDPDAADTEHYVDFVYQPLTEHDGTVSGIFVEGYDVTERKRAHEALRAADRRKDEFLAMLAHELRNPLAPISNAAELLRLQSADNPRINQASDVIARQVAHMSGLVDDLLDVARVTGGLIKLDMQPVEMHSVVAGAVEQVRSLIAARGHRLAVQADDDALFACGDRTRLVQVVANLLNNAARYTPDGGSIALRLAADDSDVRILVQDNGVGIAAALLPHVFELFTQAERAPDRSQGGLGLGLPLVKNLVELHGGQVAAYSDGPGKGSTFAVTLPRLLPSAVNDALPEEPAQARHAETGMRVMIVDDNVDAAESLTMLLRAGGYDASACFNAGQALEKAGAIAPRVFLLDVGLPDMDGYALARQLRAQPAHANALLIALTGYGQPHDFARSRQAGFDHHLVKPAKVADILKLLAAASRAEMETGEKR
ncbi:MAG TPA: ATP-binding protein [Noviherbaspirillum sp.]|jgi:PAS domain S-box-containing protein|uniref:hybrid sensor histidine kinase/response regulator n=1 Tax=Noviherbaspirillum sp. TaxID=1926288 RepID=UPI002F959842